MIMNAYSNIKLIDCNIKWMANWISYAWIYILCCLWWFTNEAFSCIHLTFMLFLLANNLYDFSFSSFHCALFPRYSFEIFSLFQSHGNGILSYIPFIHFKWWVFQLVFVCSLFFSLLFHILTALDTLWIDGFSIHMHISHVLMCLWYKLCIHI